MSKYFSFGWISSAFATWGLCGVQTGVDPRSNSSKVAKTPACVKDFISLAHNHMFKFDVLQAMGTDKFIRDALEYVDQKDEVNTLLSQRHVLLLFKQSNNSIPKFTKLFLWS